MSDIERVARAIHLMDLKAEFPECAQYTIDTSRSIWCKSLNNTARDHYRTMARAAIEAIQPQAMGDLPEHAALAGEDAMARNTPSYSGAHDVFASIIDAILNEGDRTMTERRSIVQLPDGSLQCMACENVHPISDADRRVIGGVAGIDTVQSAPEEYPNDGDPMLPKWGVTAFFQHRDEAEAFIRMISTPS